MCSSDLALITSGDEVLHLGRFLQGRAHYAASDVLAYLTRETLTERFPLPDGVLSAPPVLFECA